MGTSRLLRIRGGDFVEKPVKTNLCRNKHPNVCQW